MAAPARKVSSIAEAAERGWRPDGRPRRASAPRRVSAEVLLRSPLFVVGRTTAADRETPYTRSSRSGSGSTAPRLLPLTIGPETRLYASLWRKQDKYYAAILVGLAALAWWNPF